MSNEKPNNNREDYEHDFTDVDLALDLNSDYHDEYQSQEPGKDNEEFQKEFRAVFEGKDEEAQKSKKKFLAANPDGAVAGIYDWIRCVILAVTIVVFCLTFVFRLVEVDGTSMMDTLENHDKVIVTNMFYTPHNNDIIVISHATNYDHPIIKRVIATGGQTVRLDYENDKIFVDGIELSEPYIKGSTFSNNGSEDENYLAHDDQGNFVIPEGKLFVLGDNRKVSLDSRSAKIGLIDVNDVIGKAQFVAFPFNHWGYVYDK